MLSKSFVMAVRNSKEPQHTLAKYGDLTPAQLSSMINGRTKVKSGDGRILKLGNYLGLKSKECFLDDPFLYGAWLIKNPMSSLTYSYGRNILPRWRDSRRSQDVETKTFTRDPDYLLCSGAAVGLCSDGVVRHIWLDLIRKMRQRFCGFHVSNQLPNRAVVYNRGQYMLMVQELDGAKSGSPVFCFGPNDFTVDSKVGGVQIGSIDYIQPDFRHRASVLFKACGDTRSFNLSTLG